MCGRASLPNDVSELKQDLRIEWDKLGDYKPRWNAAPTSDLPVVTSSSGHRTLALMRWGLIPSWAKEPAKEPAKNSKIGRSTFNARAEGIDTKPAFRGAWKAKYNQDFKLSDKEQVVFGTPIDVALSELAVECFYFPADDRTRKALEAAEIDVLERRVVVIPAKDWGRFKAWAAKPARELAGIKELARRPPTWRK